MGCECLCLLVITLTCVQRVHCGAGLWMDDGFGQTILADTLDEDETAKLGRQMLDLLDLPPPMNRMSHVRSRHYAHLGSAPNWLKGVYNILDDRGHAKSNQLDANHKLAVSRADVIITFVTKDHSADNHSMHHGSNRRIYFDFSDVPLDHSLLNAELHFFRRKGFTEPVTIHFYKTEDESGGEAEIYQANLQEGRWTSVNITIVTLSWLIFPETNLGLRFAIKHRNQKHEMNLREAGVAGSHDEEDLRPFLVGFFTLPEGYGGNQVRNVQPTAAPTARSHRRSYRSIAEDRNHLDTLCQLRHLHVSFKDLGWQDWVIAPEGYDANFCDGRCEFPLQADMNATNHAIVQTLVKVIGGVKEGSEVPPSACCAPTDLATIPVLYYAYTNNVVLKKYPKMIVKSCGCQ